MKCIFSPLLSPSSAVFKRKGSLLALAGGLCLEKFSRLLFSPGDCRPYNSQLHPDACPDLRCVFGTVSWFATPGPPPWELPVTSTKTPDASWERIMLLAPALVHKEFIAYFAYLYSLVMRTVQNACLKSVQNLSFSADTRQILQKGLKDFPSALYISSLHF